MTKELDRRFRHVGRIKRSWGTNHKPTIRRMEEMMSGLFERGRLDILRLIQDGTYSPLQVYDSYRTNELERLPTAATLAPLKESMEKWIAKKECSEAHRRSLSQSLRHLLSAKRSHSCAVGDIASLLTSYRERICGTQSGRHARSFNLARAAAQAFAKTTAGRNSKLWSDISAIEVLRVTPQRRKHPLSPTELTGIVGQNISPLSNNAWQMALTGMGPAEYWGKWHVEGIDRVRIFGTKRKGRDRTVPYVRDFMILTPPQGSYVTFRKQLAEASGGTVTPYDMRRSYANWLESAGIPRTRRKLYLGHGATDVTDLYEWHEVELFLAEDAERLFRYAVSDRKTQGIQLVRKA